MYVCVCVGGGGGVGRSNKKILPKERYAGVSLSFCAGGQWVFSPGHF